MTTPSFAERTKIISILRGLLQGDEVDQGEESSPKTSLLVTEHPGDVSILLKADVQALESIIESGAFILERPSSRYAGATRLRAKGNLPDYRRLLE